MTTTELADGVDLGTAETPTGVMIVDGGELVGDGDALYSADPVSGERVKPGYPSASPEQVADVCAQAAAAFAEYRSAPAERRAGFLDAIADRLDDARDALVDRAHRETALPRPRLTGEVGRTSGQLRLFASELRAGFWQGARVDPAIPDRAPAPRSDIRQRRIGIGPVAVFGASNFPLAFSTAGGDTASALAAGCPVVVKAHPAHLGTAELVGRAVAAAAASTGMPRGVFAQIVGGVDVGQALVGDPHIRAVGFTGSRRGGLALAATAAARGVPIPVYAEMSSINPVVLLPNTLAADGARLGTEFAASMTLGAGQFCTNPGLVIAVDGPGLDEFVAAATDAVAGDEGATMLTTGIADAYRAGGDELAARAGVVQLAVGTAPATAAGAAARLFRVDADRFAADPGLQSEVFGATSLLVVCPDLDRLRATLDVLEGQLTATVHASPEDHGIVGRLLPALEDIAGRLIVNGWPTGVEVGHAIVHGGPFPATTDTRSTSVGSAAIERFLRPVAYQDVPAELLPTDISDPAPAGIHRRLDGRTTEPASEGKEEQA
ncbi:aldehyde dehydrogenase (NADP(+)) [Gordonia soli]|uniref:Putative aldehyde dehydrogenase n=1 Tax=Gordonia soli NBRC 108243 TaxID=1223545 RepID=M0QPJ7_9ACTN|nr:aldehyde dehydrogenase (NADP(+)) [Gordonia soli]GAC70600.1 putative aldehyde dehydrogenase [Gordonia soli NBRC 108243]